MYTVVGDGHPLGTVLRLQGMIGLFPIQLHKSNLL